MSASPSAPRASGTAERFVKQLNVAHKAVRLYPPASSIPCESASAALATLRTMLRDDPDVRISITKEGFFHEEGAVFPGQPAFTEFAHEFFSRRLAEVRFHSGTTITEIIEFLRVLDTPLGDILACGGFESRLWDSHVVNITVREATTRVVDYSGLPTGAEEPPEEWPPPPETIDEILAEFSAGRPRDQVVLVRFVDSPEALDGYLQHAAKGRGATPPATWLTNRVSALATAVAGLDPEERAKGLDAIAQSMMSVDEDVLVDALRERILPGARHDEPLAEVVRRGGIDRVCAILAAGLEDSDESREGLARAFHNLLQISDLDRAQVLGASAAALDASGVDADTTDGILASVNPETITVRDVRGGEEHSSIERIVRLVDMTPLASPVASDSPELAELMWEAREGITDGDILRVLVALITIEQRDESFYSLMSIVEDGLDLLVTRHEYHLAASATDALAEAAEDGARAAHQRARIGRALDGLASKPNTRAIAAAMRRNPPDSLEYKACRHLLLVLGRHAIEPLLEVLADEPDMSARKAIVALISEMAEEHIDELGAHLGDERWYFVRNVVTILGATRAPQTLALLGRTMRYPDARVRRETIRAASGIRDALAVEMLLAALEDTDGQNVQLAARYLGLLDQRSAIAGLERVAAAQGTGNRDAPARIEAIEALGRLASATSLPLLRSLSRGRGRRGRARSREVASAAEAAIRAIERTMSSGTAAS